MMGNGYGYGMGGGGMSGYWWFGLLVLVGVALLVVVLVRVNKGGVSGSAPMRNGDRPSELGEARRILDERYARGDLTTEEYRERIQGLGQKV
jgi:putative membrane protein